MTEPQAQPVTKLTVKKMYAAAGYKSSDLQAIVSGQSIYFGRIFGIVEGGKVRATDLGPYVEFEGAFGAICLQKTEGADHIKLSSSRMILPSSAEFDLLEACGLARDALKMLGDLSMGVNSLKFQFGVTATYDAASPSNYAWLLDNIEAGKTATLLSTAQTQLFAEFAPEIKPQLPAE